MPDFNVRSDSVNVEQIMEQIRTRIREKRGVDYTEQQIRELAAVKLEKFLDPRGVRSDLLEQFRQAQPVYEPPELPNFAFEESTLFESHRAPIRWMRALFGPFLKLFFNPNPLIQALNIQSRLNTMNAEREATREATRRGMDQLYYELIHNLVVETTRLGIEVKNLKMRLESVSSRLEFNERRARALESAVVYKPSPEEVVTQRTPAPPVQQARTTPAPQIRPTPPPPAHVPSVVAVPPVPNPAAGGQSPSTGPGDGGVPGEGPGQRSRRRRRRRGRRGGASASGIMGAPGTVAQDASASGSPVATPAGSSQADQDHDQDMAADDSPDVDQDQFHDASPHAASEPREPQAIVRAEGTIAPSAAPSAPVPAPVAGHAPETDTGPAPETNSGHGPSTGSGHGGSDPNTQ